jgi:uncharacterized RDD family membrane protein YckC
MTMADDYVKSVLDWMPHTMRRAQIGTELQSHIAERVAEGHPLHDVLRQLGDPVALAESYLAEVPLVAAPYGGRIAAKLVDLLLFIVAIAAVLIPAFGLAWFYDSVEVFWIAAILVGIIMVSIGFGVYNVVAEWRYGQTVGKRLLGLRVVRESGAQIGLGQSVVRQLPAVFQVFWIDVLFALFTDKRQRAFEMLSKTRVVVAVD